MSSSDRSPRRAVLLGRVVLLALAVLPALALGGCFRPMYASTSVTGGPNMVDKLAAVEIAPIPVGARDARVAQQVRNTLDFAFTGGGNHAPTRYVLTLDVRANNSDVIVDAVRQLPEVDNVLVTSTFTLTPIGSETPVLHGKDYGRKSYDLGRQRYAAVRARRDAENGAAEIVAEAIKTRVAAYLAGQP